MGMYTELHLYVGVDLKDFSEVPNEFYSVLRGGGLDMFRNARTSLVDGVLEIHSSFKNYEEELQKFLVFLKPHIAPSQGAGFIGFYTTDYDNAVTNIFYDEISRNGVDWETVIVYKTTAS